MTDLIKRSDAINAINTALRWVLTNPSGEKILNKVPSADRPQGWVDKAISIIDEMEIEGIIAYEQACEYRMRARMKGTDDE